VNFEATSLTLKFCVQLFSVFLTDEQDLLNFRLKYFV